MSFASVTWTPADVQSLTPKLTSEEAEQWLLANENRIRDRLIERGWDLISNLLATSGIDTSDPEPEGDEPSPEEAP